MNVYKGLPVVGGPRAGVRIGTLEYPLDPAGQSRAPAYGPPPGAAMSQGQRCGGCRHFVTDPANPLQGYCKLFRFIAEATKWCAAWEA